MSFNIHLADLFILDHTNLSSQDILNRFGTRSDAGYTKLEFTTLSFVGPVVTSCESLCQRLSNVRGILALLDIIELVGESFQILSFDNVCHMLRVERLPAKMINGN